MVAFRFVEVNAVWRQANVLLPNIKGVQIVFAGQSLFLYSGHEPFKLSQLQNSTKMPAIITPAIKYGPLNHVHDNISSVHKKPYPCHSDEKSESRWVVWNGFRIGQTVSESKLPPIFAMSLRA